VQLRAERTTSDGCLTHEPGCIVTTPLNPASRFPKGYYVMFGDPANPQWGSDPDQGLFYGHYKWEVGKVGLDSRAGWAAFANTSAGYAFAVQFTTFPDQKYPDNGAGVEFWTVGRGQVANLDYEKSDIYLMECEVLSPFQHIAPGQTASFQIEWGAGRCTGPVVDVAEAGCASRKLHIERQGEYALIDGAFSVFDLGQLELKWIDRAGREIECVDLGPASPLAAVSIDRVCRVPAGAAEARLVVNAGDVSRGLACASL
jgi:hypothetical protein